MPGCSSPTTLRATEPVGSVNGQIDGEQGYTCIMVTLVAGILQDGGCSIESLQGLYHGLSGNDVDVQEDK